MVEKLKNVGRRNFIKGTVATLTSLPFMDATESIAGLRWNKYSVHEAVGRTVLIDTLMELDVPYPGNWQQMLGGADSGIVVNTRYHRLFVFKNGHLIKTLPVSTGSRPRHSTPTGLRHIGFKDKDYKSNTYPLNKKLPRAPMPSSSFLDNAQGDNEGIAIHGSSKFKKDRHGREVVKLDSSHGCLNMRKSDASYLYDFYDKGTPVYIMNHEEGALPNQNEGAEDILSQISDAELAMKDIDNIFTGSRAESVKMLKDIIPRIPAYFNLTEALKKQVYGLFEHALKYSATNPAVRLREAPVTNSPRFNAVRIGGNRLLGVVGKRLAALSNDGITRMLTQGKYKRLKSQELTESTEKQLHGTWATIFGYGHDKRWTQSYVGGLLVRDPRSNTLMLVTKDPASIIRGMPVHARVDGEFQFCGTVRGGGQISNGLYGYKIHGPSAVKGM